jgi:plasmid stability protein
MPAKQLTIRNVSPELAQRLKSLAEHRNESVNATLLYILRQVLDVNERRKRLQRYVTWSPEDAAEFEDALKEQRQIDHELWR